MMKNPHGSRLAVMLVCLSLTACGGTAGSSGNSSAPAGSSSSAAAGTQVATADTRAASTKAGGMLGFTDAGADKQKSLEKKFDSMLNATQMRAWLKRLSSEPNQVGSPH